MGWGLGERLLDGGMHLSVVSCQFAMPVVGTRSLFDLDREKGKDKNNRRSFDSSRHPGLAQDDSHIFLLRMTAGRQLTADN